MVSEAVRDYCAKELERELEAAYRADRDEASGLAAEWEPADAEVPE